MILLFASLGWQPAVVEAQKKSDVAPVDFTRQVQPIFARRCYKCHGPNQHEAGLRFNSRKAATTKLESGQVAIDPGNPAGSSMLRRLKSTDPEQKMPPEGKPLSADEVRILENWIRQGAAWDEHWAFRSLKRPTVPVPQATEWVRDPIDAFVLHRLEAAGLQPAPPAEKIALLRRAHYDLLGLPPSPQAVRDFLADDSPAAFESVVDRLLESQRYGEKWARHWLDLVRYAETNGYERDSRKDLIWKYRDYVIRAYNEDKPFNRFILEQLAGDELADKDADSITATGFYRLGIWDDEPADRLLARYDYLDDILRTTGESFLGMTIGCARCHDHKIDPVSQKDYYSMLAFFSDISPHGKGNTNHVPVASAADQAEYERQVLQRRNLQTTLTRKLGEFETAFLTRLKQKHPDVKLEVPRPKSVQDGVVLPDSIKAPQTWEYTLKKPAGNWFEIAFDDSRWKRGPGGFGTRGTPGAVVRTVWRKRDIWLRKDFQLSEIPAKLILNIHHDEDAEVYLNGQAVIRFKGYVTSYKSVDLTKQALDVLQTGRNTLAIHCRQTGGGQYIDAGLRIDGGPTPISVLAGKYGAELLGKDRMAEWQRLRKELVKISGQEIQRKTQFAMAVAESGRRQTWILQRGNPTSKGPEVEPAYPQILNPPRAEVTAPAGTKTSGKRLALARWIASPDHPTTARVIVNRIWQHHFGRGLARTSSDFGFQGSPPTHPQLLDWLASEFISGGWRLKALHKRIMMSNVYRMSSAGNQAALAQDPVNNLFWRFNMRRLTAEEIRDSILAVGGTLNTNMYGPSIYPPLSREVLATASRPNAAWGKSSAAEAARRSIYVHVKRSLRPPMMVNFDAPDPDTLCAVRMNTTVPTQALGMLNSDFLNAQAKLLAERLQREHPGKLDRQVAAAVQLTTGRKSKPDEIRADLAFIQDLIDQEKFSPVRALQTYCLLALNANEFVYLD